MDATKYIVCLWPGLPELWYRGRWSGLPAAVMFAICLNFLIVARFIYPEWLVPALVRVACWVGVGVWGMLVVRAAGRLPALIHPRATSDSPDAFPQARQHYLRGQREEAEAVLVGCLEIDPRDSQAMLLLACIYRQTGRFEAAQRCLDQIGRLETGDGWWLECAAERERLRRHIEASEESDEESGGTESEEIAREKAAEPLETESSA